MADGIWLEDELELIGDGWRPGRGSITWILSTPISSTSLLLIRIASGDPSIKVSQSHRELALPVLQGRAVQPVCNKHMLRHSQETGHALALSFSDLSVWCFACDSYIDAQVLSQLRPPYETAYIMKFRESLPLRTVEIKSTESGDNPNPGPSSSK
ncbi:hypothetical protein MLD38_026694 [Melastoma candidum]|uniref:Uncharacterized protein n=1 Tax=Melastoma candidum TaxID=119954 RepID=A0ACB9P2B5_9MYRT|nr:hypothetical protein MLD38_026694 [Melastoma candidum]